MKREKCTPCDVLNELGRAYDEGIITKEQYIKALILLNRIAE
jgi:uncharacterized protein YqgQ